MDYKQLLVKYIALVLKREGVHFIDGDDSDAGFTDEEWATLSSLSVEAIQQRAGES
jgi:hypothetical protein